MEFNDSPAEAAFRLQARQWLTANAEPKDPDIVQSGVFVDYPSAAEVTAAQSWQRKKFDAGWAGVFWAKEFGGRGGTILEQIIWDQEEGQFQLPPKVLLLSLGHVAYTIMAHGSDAQKIKYLPPTLRGDLIWCQLFSEPGAGSDFGGLATRAEQTDDGQWLISGEKIWISDGDYASHGLLVTRTDPNAPKHKGMTCFLIDMKTPGITVENVRHINGGSHFSHVTFNQLRLDDDHRLGEINNGWKTALTTLMYERFFVGAWGSSGAFGGPTLHHLITLARETIIDGKPALDRSWVRQKIARFIVRNKALQHSSYRVLTTVSRGGIPGPEGSIVKMSVAHLAQEMTNFALELQGPEALLLGVDAPMAGAWQDAFMENPCMRIAGGTDEIQRTILAERILGLPQESLVPRDLPFKDIPHSDLLN